MIMTLVEKVASALKIIGITQEDLRLHKLNECCKACLACKGKKWIKKRINKGFKSGMS